MNTNEIQRQQKENQVASPSKVRDAKLAAKDSALQPLDERPQNKEHDNPEATASPKRIEKPEVHSTYSVPDTEKETEARRDKLEDRGEEDISPKKVHK